MIRRYHPLAVRMNNILVAENLQPAGNQYIQTHTHTFVIHTMYVYYYSVLISLVLVRFRKFRRVLVCAYLS